jgi:Met-zincin/Domain of unknown function (DUF5117)
MTIQQRFLAMLLAASPCVAFAQEKPKTPTPPVTDTAKAKKPPVGITEKIKSSKKMPGLFTIYQDTATGATQVYIRKDQLGKEFIYQSFSMGGPTSLGLNQSMHRANFIFKMQKTFDKIEFAAVNTNFYYDPNNAVSKAANVDVPGAIFYTDKFAAEDSTGYLVAGDALFISEKLDPVKPNFPPGTPPTAFFNLGGLNPLKSKIAQVRSYPGNTDVVVDLAYENPMPFNGGGKDITDPRFNRVKIQHSFIEMPKGDFRARRDDPRIGYFGSEVDDLTSISPTPYKDVINRWNLKKKDSNAPLSDAAEPVVYWIENTTPVEYRQTIKEAGEKWNEAFEKAGIKNAIVMKIMPDTATWDAGDINYNVIRWVSSTQPPYGAIGPSFTNPRTGQILGTDITVEWKSGAGTPNFEELFNGGNAAVKAVQLPWQTATATDAAEAIPHFGFSKQHMATCTMAHELQAQYITGLTTVEALDEDMPDDSKNAGIIEMHKQFLYYLIMHEMGHTLGLNHNMKASQMLSPAQLHDKALTRKIGLQGSVMDYPAINVSLDRSKQGDYYTTKAGPYDLWAIEYGYTPFAESEEEAGLNKILARSTDPQLIFGNDADDMRSPGSGIDPRVMVNDHSNDMVAYAEERLKLVNSLMPKLKARFSRDGKSYQELRGRYGTLNGQRNQMITAVSRYIGGVYVDRSMVGQSTTTKPFTPVPVAYQKKALELLSKYVYAPNAFDADAQLFPYLQSQRRGFAFFGATEDPKPQNTFLNMQMNSLSGILNPVTLTRISTSSLYGNTYSVADVMGDLVKAIFNEDLKTNVNLYRQNLQTEFVKGASGIALGAGGYDNPSKAAALLTLKKIRTLLGTAISPNEQTKAHRSSLLFLIDKALKVD